ncbi:MAG TPA: thioester reductase domain-containing protein [Streptosporangiaceae bacterium]|nr:thioester reductase domain-containing protein [Streptosporangiaceae bacterium]
MTRTASANDPLATSESAEFRRELRDYARSRLPEAMVPARFLILDRLPTLPNGKIDRRRLPAVAAATHATAPAARHIAPRTAAEAKIARIWRDVLGTEAGVEDSFFETGGNSLTAVRMIARVREEFGAALSLRRLFERPTIAELARMVSADPADLPAQTGDSRSIPADLLAAEAELPSDVAPEPGARWPVPGVTREVVLTGATGFTGAFLLRQLLDRSPARVWALVRASDPADAIARIQANMAAYRLWREEDGQRIAGVPADLSRPYLGLSRASYAELAAKADTVVHNGSWSSFVLPYDRLKPVNVLGTLELLRLACREQVKRFHYVSSLAVFPGHREIKHFREEELDDPDGVVGGYPQTKWVSDRLVTQAGRRGLPVSVYRPGQITGASDTGACPTELFVCAMMKSCIQLGLAPDPDMMVEMVPVDYAAAAIAHVVLNGASVQEGASVQDGGAAQDGTAVRGPRIFHLPGEQSVHWIRVIDMISACGYPVRRVHYSTWYEALTEATSRGEDNALAPFMPLLGEDGPSEDLAYQNGSPQFESGHLTAALEGSQIVTPPLDEALLATYTRYFTEIGYLPTPAQAPEDRR